MPTLKDNRTYQAMTVQQADDLFLAIARRKAALDKENAAHKRKLAEMEAAHKAKLDPMVAELTAMQAELTSYIMANPGRFVKPRKHPVGQIGTYGMTTDPAYVTITDKVALTDYALENGYDDLYHVEHVPDKPAILTRLMRGEDIPGATMTPPGDVAKMTYKQGYAEQLGV